MQVGRRNFVRGLLSLVGAAIVAPALPQLPPPPPLWIPPEPRVFQLDRTMLQPKPGLTMLEAMADQLEKYNGRMTDLVNRLTGLGHGVVSIEGKPVATMREWSMEQRADLVSSRGFGERPFGQVRRMGHLEGYVFDDAAAERELARAWEERREISVQVNDRVYSGRMGELRWGNDGSISFDATLTGMGEHVGNGQADVADGHGGYSRADGAALHLPTRPHWGGRVHRGPSDPDDGVQW